MKRTIIFSLLCMMLALPAMAQPGYRYGRGPQPRVQTVSRHGNEYIAWHRYYVGLRVGLNASHVNSDSPVLNGSSMKSGLNIGIAAGTQLSYRTPLFLETGLYYSQKGVRRQPDDYPALFRRLSGSGHRWGDQELWHAHGVQLL